MAASLPTENALGKAVNEFGIGTYDSDNGITKRGEDDEDPKSETSPHGDALPGTHGTDPFGPDRLLSYPQTFASDRLITTSDGRVTTIEKYTRELADRLRDATGILPGDQETTTHQHPNMDVKEPVTPSVAEASELPSDEDNPSPRADYYDRMKMGFSGNEWPDEDSGAWASEDDSSNLPGVTKNEVTMDNFLNSIGNFWSGHETEDVSGPQGFPSEDFSENVNYDRSDLQDGGHTLASETRIMNRQATNIELVTGLTQDFVKKFGKKDLTRRHVMSFLSGQNQPQFLASDIIRCLKLRHSVFVKDVLDEFPIAKTASDGKSSLASIREKLIQLEISSILEPEVSAQFRRCAANISNAIAGLERLEARNG
jgi:hypothetical protein